jgi:hypothetical protein
MTYCVQEDSEFTCTLLTPLKLFIPIYVVLDFVQTVVFWGLCFRHFSDKAVL